MKFKLWLENQGKDVNFALWGNDGTVVFYIDGKRYSYLTDTFYHTKWKNKIRHSPKAAIRKNSWEVVKEIERTGTRLSE